MKNRKENKLFLTNSDLNIFEKKFITNDNLSSHLNSTIFSDYKSNILYNNPDNIKVNDKDLEYKINSYGFRSDNFDNKMNSNIVFAGCSETFGWGGQLEECWAYMTNSYLNNKSYINLGVLGASYEQIIHNSLFYIEKYGHPKNLFILFPNVERQIFYDFKPFYILKSKKRNITKVLRKKNTSPNYYNWPLPPTVDYYRPFSSLNAHFPKKYKTNNFSYKTSLFKFYETIKMFELLMKEYNINFYWTINSYMDKNNLNMINKLNNFIYYEDVSLYNYMSEYQKKYKNQTNAILKIDGHCGVAVHDYWKNLFLEKVIL